MSWAPTRLIFRRRIRVDPISPIQIRGLLGAAWEVSGVIGRVCVVSNLRCVETSDSCRSDIGGVMQPSKASTSVRHRFLKSMCDFHSHLQSLAAGRRCSRRGLHLPPATNECRCLCCVSIVKALFTSMVERHRFFKKSVYTLAVAGRFTCRSHEPRASECMYRLCKKSRFLKYS